MLVSIAYTCLATYPHTAISADQNTTALRRESDHSNNEPWSDHSNNEPWVELMFVKRVACNYTVTYAANVLPFPHEKQSNCGKLPRKSHENRWRDLKFVKRVAGCPAFPFGGLLVLCY